MKKLNQNGVIDLTFIILMAALLVVGGFAYWRIKNSNPTTRSSIDDSTASGLSEFLPENLDNLKTLEEIEQIAGASEGVGIIRFELESKDGGYVYKVVLSNGKKLVIDATTGSVLSEEMTDVSEDDKIPAGVSIAVSPAEAYKIAAAKSSSPVKKIEMEVEDKKVVYKIEYKDGSKIEIDASSGAIVKSEIKSESEDDDDENEEEDEDENDDEEEDDDEDSDDSQDSQDHEEEDN